MSDQSRKKAQKRLKRERKRQSMRRAASVSPYKRVAQQGELLECWMNVDWLERGQTVIYVLRRGTDGKLAFASFLIDMWCAGLKDAWGRLDVLRDEFEGIVDTMSERLDDTMALYDADDAADILAGGIRFAMQNGFRLPSDYKRWAGFLGELNVQDADLSDFGKDGGLLWCGPMHDLQARLIGSTVEVFLARPDVHYITEIGAPVSIEEEDEELSEPPLSKQELAMNASVDRLLANVVPWLEAENEVPSKLLRTVATVMLTSTVITRNEDGEIVPEAARAEQLKFAEELGEMRPDLMDEYAVAMEQINRALAGGALRKTHNEAAQSRTPADAPA